MWKFTCVLCSVFIPLLLCLAETKILGNLDFHGKVGMDVIFRMKFCPLLLWRFSFSFYVTFVFW